MRRGSLRNGQAFDQGSPKLSGQTKESKHDQAFLGKVRPIFGGS
jgi:hypothetical protein